MEEETEQANQYQIYNLDITVPFSSGLARRDF